MNLEDCACTQIVESFSPPLKYPSHEYLAGIGILAGLIILYSIGSKIGEKVRKL